MKALKDILEASLLDIDSQLEIGNKLENVSLTTMMDSKSKGEFEMLFNAFRSLFEDKYSNKLVNDVKPRKTYIVFVENLSMKGNYLWLCKYSIYMGTTRDLYRLTYLKDAVTENDRTTITKTDTLGLDYFTRPYKHLDIKIYECPNNIKKEANKLIIYNLE